MPPRRNAQRGSGSGQGDQGGDATTIEVLQQILELLRQQSDNNNRNHNHNNLENEELQQNERLPNPPIVTFKTFQAMNPPEFRGTVDPVEAKTWLKEVENAFEMVDVGDEQKTKYGAYFMRGEAAFWWEATKALEGAAVISWARFTELFLEKYFPAHLEDQMELKFLELKQRDMTVPEYEAKFTELARFVPSFVDTDRKRAKRFQHGLKPWIQNRIAVLELATYAAVVQKASIVESGDELVKRDRDERKRKADTQEVGQGSRRVRRDYGRNRGFRQRNYQMMTQPEPQIVNQQRQPPPVRDCRTCGRKHWGACSRSDVKCFNCNQFGHYAKECRRQVCESCGRGGHLTRNCRFPIPIQSIPAPKQIAAPPCAQPTARTYNMITRGTVEHDAIVAGTLVVKIP